MRQVSFSLKESGTGRHHIRGLMTTEQIFLFLLLGVVFVLLIWGRIRYDLVAFGALVVALIAGAVPADKAFDGFGHPATIIVALVLIVSKALSNSGAIELIARYAVDAKRAISSHVAVMAGISASLSAVMNNVAALALLMPVDMQAADKAKRSPALTLMPLSFASILGGLITLIGTPPNIIIAAYREQALGTSYTMFDFAPVGLAVAIVGVAFIALVGWRLIPSGPGSQDPAKQLFEVKNYIANVRVPERSEAVGKLVRDLDPLAEENDVWMLGLIRGGKRLSGQARRIQIREGDILILEAGPKAIDSFVGALKLEYEGQEKKTGDLMSGTDLSLVEVVVPEGARINGRSSLELRLLKHHGVTLLGVSRRGEPIYRRIRQLRIQTGDVLLLLGPSERLPTIADWIGGLPLGGRDLELVQHDKAWLTVAIFVAAIGAAVAGFVDLPVALAAAVTLYVGLNIVPLRNVYTSIEWPVIVLLGAMIPLGTALETSGGTALIARQIVEVTAGHGPVMVLTALIVVTMVLTAVLNNTATAVIAAPIAIDIAKDLSVSPDPFLMAIAVAASCAFVTPIGHKNNVLIMGPGGYRFGDYWKMGLPLSVLVVAVAVPAIMAVWPF